MSNETYYTILGVNPTDNAATIRKAYFKLSLKFHPDKNPDNPEAATEQFVKIGHAYEVLSDPTSRSAYDRELKYGRPTAGSTNTNANYNANYNNSNSSYGDNNSSSSNTYERPPAKSYDTYREAFDNHLAGMSEDELRAAMGAAAVIGGLVGSLLGSGLGKKFAGNSKVGRAIFETAGSLLGSTVGSEAGVGLVQNVHGQSRDRITYEERKRVAQQRGQPLPEKPKEGWEDLMGSVNKTMNAVKDQMQGNAQPQTGRGQAFQSMTDAMKFAKKMAEAKQQQPQAYR